MVIKMNELRFDTELLERTNKYLKENHISKAQLAADIDTNRTSVSLYLGQNETIAQGTIDKIEEQLRDYLAEPSGESKPDRTANANKLIHITADAERIVAICQSCQDYMGAGLITGRSGFGKTYTLKYYARAPKVAYIECNESMNARDLIKAIERALSLPHMSGSIDDRLDNIKDFFNSNSGYLLIIDEADKLITKYTQKKAEILRSIFDSADVGLIIAGEPTLKKTVKQYIPRLANRIDLFYDLEGLSESEVSDYISGYEFDEEAKRELIKRATNDKNGCFRLLNRTFNNVIRMSGGHDVITYEDVKNVSGMMLL